MNVAKGRTSKLSPKSRGPYEITDIVSEHAIEILKKEECGENDEVCGKARVDEESGGIRGNRGGLGQGE
jgi:hypothetical protein